MGMGEPLQNYENVMKAIEILNDGRGLALSSRRITLSTAGLLPGIERLAGERLFPNLSLLLAVEAKGQINGCGRISPEEGGSFLPWSVL